MNGGADEQKRTVGIHACEAARLMHVRTGMETIRVGGVVGVDGDEKLVISREGYERIYGPKRGLHVGVDE